MEGRAHLTGYRLAVETSILALLVGGWLWAIVALGAHEMAAQGAPPDGGGGPPGGAMVSCPAPREPEEEGGSAVDGDVCGPESRLHAGTSRQPGRSPQNAPRPKFGERPFHEVR